MLKIEDYLQKKASAEVCGKNAPLRNVKNKDVI
jgi:hypothetical protein